MSRIIDIHAHVVLRETFGAAGIYGPDLGEEDLLQTFRVGDYSIRVPYVGSVFMEVDRRIQEMDRRSLRAYAFMQSHLGTRFRQHARPSNLERCEAVSG